MMGERDHDVRVIVVLSLSKPDRESITFLGWEIIVNLIWVKQLKYVYGGIKV